LDYTNSLKALPPLSPHPYNRLLRLLLFLLGIDLCDDGATVTEDDASGYE